MSCKDEERKRKTYGNVRRLAEICAGITGEEQVVFREAGGTYGFCAKTQFTPEKGTAVAVLPQR